MGEVLSQNEIDSLLKALSSGELDVDEMKDEDKKQVKNYDFARPAKFSKEHLRTLEIIFEHYGRLLSTNLPVYLRKNVQVEVMNSEAVTYSEFSNALSNPVLLGTVNASPLNGSTVIEMAQNLGYVVVDRMLGGKGVPLDIPRLPMERLIFPGERWCYMRWSEKNCNFFKNLKIFSKKQLTKILYSYIIAIVDGAKR